MSASLALLFAAQAITIPLGKPPARIEPPRAPVERSGPAWLRACGDSTDWNQPAPPVRIHANTYLVGTCGISSILITGTQGHILIDGGTEQGADLIADNIRRLGFKLTDIRFLLSSHEHLDHVGGLARLQQLTGATVVSSALAKPVLASGVVSSDDPQSGMHKPFAGVIVGRTIVDGQALPLGNLFLTARTTPGHTPGALTWTWETCEGAVCRSMVYADSLSPVSSDAYRFSDHPAYLAAYRASLAKVAALRCEILLTPHPSASNMRDRMAGLKPLFDPDGCKNYSARLTEALDQRLAKEAAEK
ncbi:subclass B3 metallo-beta-lactamase [Sphingomonas sp. BN140010]|uniref:Subclass B3 metallo-beta-lactamase n=1 Tax=Sphingomonas arvum TaxID=2992113 RepID=A0ABT3JC38_9SPHN|nr:subclass B3 metallo-beta-lactamase [Sphingomonas sp. BN140010]MCW3796361.1 subclass B3 metallo-beta-lactamase [Sphingomonas sp. BN140010]